MRLIKSSLSLLMIFKNTFLESQGLKPNQR